MELRGTGGEFLSVSVLDNERGNLISIRECVKFPNLSNLIVCIKITPL